MCQRGRRNRRRRVDGGWMGAADGGRCGWVRTREQCGAGSACWTPLPQHRTLGAQCSARARPGRSAACVSCASCRAPSGYQAVLRRAACPPPCRPPSRNQGRSLRTLSQLFTRVFWHTLDVCSDVHRTGRSRQGKHGRSSPGAAGAAQAAAGTAGARCAHYASAPGSVAWCAPPQPRPAPTPLPPPLTMAGCAPAE